jgi:hypothetical protein
MVCSIRITENTKSEETKEVVVEAGTFAFTAISLFMIHEFEEIVFVTPWIDNE